MRIEHVHIENYRSIRDLSCGFQEVTSLVGPNGAGKSNVLRAMDWFFNGATGGLGDDDFFRGAGDNARIRVQVDFVDLTEQDRAALGPRYCPDPDVDRFTAWRTLENGEEKISGRAKAYPPFEVVRAGSSAADRRKLYGEIRDTHGLPNWTNNDAAESAMHQWELDHVECLVDAETSDSHFFGFHGQGVLSSLFDFVFVAADLRAAEETVERKDSMLDRIVSRALSRADFDDGVREITEVFGEQYRKLGEQHLDQQLANIGAQITKEVEAFSPGRRVRLAQARGSLRVAPSSIGVQVDDRGAQTPVTHQGHGFQRTLLVAGLRVLSRQLRGTSQSTSMFLAIEEPELFQHPTQARAFASVLRNLAMDDSQRTQVAYATHSPHFINPEYFDEVRRLTSVPASTAYPETQIRSAEIDDIVSRLDGYVSSDAVARRFGQVCLKHLPEALFAERVILVEGDDDAAILEGAGARTNELALQGICVAPVAGKSGMMIPFAILESLGVETIMVVDNDSGCASRMKRDGKDEQAIEQAVAKHVRDNRALCEFVGETSIDFPTGIVSDRLVFVPDTLEALLKSELPGWDLSRRTLIQEGRGVDGKHAATYELALRECSDELGDGLAELISVCTDRARAA